MCYKYLENWSIFRSRIFHYLVVEFGSRIFSGPPTAAVVCQVLRCELLQNMAEGLDKAAMVIAASVHDLDHMGRTSSFLVSSEHALALLYNDMSVHHSHLVIMTYYWCSDGNLMIC